MYHKVVVIGNLGSDPEMRYTPSGTAVTNFNVATSSRISKTRNGEAVSCPDGWKESFGGKHWELTTWWRVTAWRGLAETCNNYLHKGSQVYVEGEVNGTAVDGNQNPRVWTGNDGVPQARFEMTARTIKFIGGRAGGGGEGATYAEPEEPPPGFVEENDIPF